MSRTAPASMGAVLRNVLRDAVARIADPVSNAIAGLVAPEFEMHLALTDGPTRGARSYRTGRRSEEITRWVADTRARRIPTFVVEMTRGLDTKKKIVARYGANVVFEKGKPLPAATASSD